MRRISTKAWWWAFGLLIAIPAITLAVLGLGAVRADRIEREDLARLEQRDVAQQIDAAIADLFGQLENDLQGPDSFVMDDQGLVIFPADKVYFGPHGLRPRMADRHNAWPETTLQRIELALQAEAQRRTVSAASLYEDLGRDQPELQDWARFSTARVRDGSGATALLRGSAGSTDFARGLTPTGLPVAFLAVADVARLPIDAVLLYLPTILEIRKELLDGRWWLSANERRFYEGELRDLVGRIDDSQPLVPDVRLQRLSAVNEAARRALPTRRDDSSRTFASLGDDHYLLVWRPDELESNTWRGVAVSTPEIEEQLGRQLMGDLESRNFEVAIRTSDGKTIFGGIPPENPIWNTVPSKEIRSWEYAFTGADLTGSGLTQGLWYGFIGFLILVLLTGVLTTARVVRKEMELSRMQTELVAAVSHEFKSPITGIRLLVERLSGSGEISQDQSSEYYETIQRELQRLERLVDDLLATRRAESTDRQFRFEPIDVNELVNEILVLLRPQAEARGVTVEARVMDGLPSVLVDRAAMLDALENLLDNAIKFSGEDDQVIISASQVDGNVRIEVADTGTGIPDEDLDRVFDKFYRSKMADELGVKGTGLGLALVKAVVEGHDGQVQARSTLGVGSTFSVTLRTTDRA